MQTASLQDNTFLDLRYQTCNTKNQEQNQTEDSVETLHTNFPNARESAEKFYFIPKTSDQVIFSCIISNFGSK